MEPTLEMSGAVNGALWGHAAKDWAEVQESTLEPVFDAVLARTSVGPATRYLDLGCGAGMAVEKALGLGAAASGLDASGELIAIARRRAPTADLRIGDIEALPFDENGFDVVTGFNSFQYAANPARALKEAARVARPGATVVIVTWGEPDNMDAAQVVAALKDVLPPPDAPGPFALSAPDSLKGLASAGGLEPVEILDVDCPWIYPNEETALRGLASSGVAARAIRHTSRMAVDEAHARAISPFRQSDGSYHIGASFRVLLTNPVKS